MIFPGFGIKQRRSKFLIPKLYLKQRNQKRALSRGLSVQVSKDCKDFQEFKDFTLTNSAVFHVETKKKVKRRIESLEKGCVDKAVGSSSPLLDNFEVFHQIESSTRRDVKVSNQRIPRKTQIQKRIKSLNITSPVFSLRKDFKVVLVGEHVFPSILLKN